jgi:hypothetical protein
MLGGKQDWESAKIHIGDQKFLDRLHSYDKDNAGHLLPILENYIDDPRFTYDRIKKSSLCCACLANWIVGVYRYIKVFEELKTAGLLEKQEVRTQRFSTVNHGYQMDSPQPRKSRMPRKSMAKSQSAKKVTTQSSSARKTVMTPASGGFNSHSQARKSLAANFMTPQ